MWTACGLPALVSRGSSVSDGDPDTVAPFGLRRPLRRSDPSPVHCTVRGQAVIVGPSAVCAAGDFLPPAMLRRGRRQSN